METSITPDRFKSEGQCLFPYCKNKGRYIKKNKNGTILYSRFCLKHSKDPNRPKINRQKIYCDKCGRPLGDLKYRVKRDYKQGNKEGNILTVCLICKKIIMLEKNKKRVKENKIRKTVSGLKKIVNEINKMVDSFSDI